MFSIYSNYFQVFPHILNDLGNLMTAVQEAAGESMLLHLKYTEKTDL